MQFNFDFIGRKRIWLVVSVAIILTGLVAMFTRGLNLSIDFVGGTSLDVKFARATTVTEARDALRPLNLQKSIIQPVEKDEMLIRMQDLTKEEQAEVIGALDSKIGIVDRDIRMVGPGWGSHLTNRSLTALAVALIGLLIYISLRFEFKMAVAAILALVHDLLITGGIYALVGREVNPNTLAALLTILGYSLYDTIVVFHRIRENTLKITKHTYSDAVNKSINQILIRSINTSLTTLFPIVSILVLGGETLKDFAFALMVGVISGSYSSIFVASPFLTYLKEKEPRYRSLRVRYGDNPTPANSRAR